VCLEGVLEHHTVVVFKDVEGEKSLRKEDGVGEEHDGDFARQFHGVNLI
jgi:hypothetical protein